MSQEMLASIHSYKNIRCCSFTIEMHWI